MRAEFGTAQGPPALSPPPRALPRFLYHNRVQSGLATVVVRGSSYLNAVAAKKRGGAGCRPVNLEGRDAGMERVLEYHGVSLSACLQTFDVMQARVCVESGRNRQRKGVQKRSS